MGAAIIPFRFEAHAVRVQVDELGQPWFNASDVCAALDFGNPRQALESHVDADDVQKLDTIDSLGRTQRANHVNESGLYALIIGSTKDTAKRFKRWVTHDVLPTIRKTGGYLPAGATLESLPPAVAKQVGGIIKAVVHKEVTEALSHALPALIHGEISKQRTGLRHGATAGQIWHEHGLPVDGLRGYPSWFGNRLAERGCSMDEGSHAEMGGRKSRLFDPDKARVAMRNGLKTICEAYVKERRGQARLFAA